MREAVLSLAERHPALCSLMNPRQTTPITYVDSPLSTAEAGADAFDAGPVPGAPIVECPVRILGAGAQDAYLSNLMSPNFTALIFSSDGSVSRDLASTLEGLGQSKVPFRVCVATQTADSGASRIADHTIEDYTGRLFTMYGAQPGTVYLIRPDQHVAARWRTGAASELQPALYRALAQA
jgi:3-(3-hydroxy-phenyl)propionate hydroxylase